MRIKDYYEVVTTNISEIPDTSFSVVAFFAHTQFIQYNQKVYK